ncbi:MAG: alpha/beta hydrolase-fold protein [Phycisphaerales bacterium]|jgi:pullulanase
MNKKQISLVVWLTLPIIIVIGLVWMISDSFSQQSRSRQAEQNAPIGAGAGSTAGANGIGELIAGHKANAAAAPGAEGKADKGAQPADAKKLVQPESLPQGFILIVEDKPKLANPGSPIYVAGTMNAWNPGNENFKLTPQSDQKWRIELKPTADGSRYAFKFTRGSWDIEELKDDMSVPENRMLAPIDISGLAPGEQPKIELSVQKWSDQKPKVKVKSADDPYRDIEVTGALKRLEVRGGAGGMEGKSRDLLVWLPPGYDDAKNATVRYPVLYLHDGQNLFEKLPNIPAEWNVDETAQDLVSKGNVRPVIIVGIPNAGKGRMSGYMPVQALEGVEPQGEKHIAWLMQEVMPRVERTFRVKTGPENTGIGGSSLGAAISLYAATKYPNVFGILLAESLPLKTGHAAAWDDYIAGVKTWPRRVYLGMGGKEAGEGNDAKTQGYVDAVKALDARLKSAGFGPDRLLLLIDPTATHNEQAWSKRFPQALTFLFPPPVDATK